MDLSIFNWPGNDYREVSIIDCPAHAVAAALQDAKRASLGFLHWVQTEAPAEGDRLGVPELRLRPDIMGTTDGLARFPYIRESRRIRGLRTIVEQDVSVHFRKGPRARRFEDSVGVGWYRSIFIATGPRMAASAAVPTPFRSRSARSFPSGSAICSRQPNDASRNG
jgi:FAD dependent oxidoreductase